MSKEIIQRLFSQVITRNNGILLLVVSLLWWAFDLDSWARTFLFGLIAKLNDVVLVAIIVFFANYPILIPVAAILLIILFLLVYDVFGALMTDWSSKIEISPDIRPMRDKKSKNKSFYNPVIRNTGSTDITECFVDLERVYWVPIDGDGKWLSGEAVKFDGRLSWLESNLQSAECKRTIERNNVGTPIRLVEMEFGKVMVIKLCDGQSMKTKSTTGELRLLIRVGGVVNDWSIKPVFAMVIISQHPQYGDTTLASADTRKIKKREDFDKWNRVLDSAYQEMNENLKTTRRAA